MICQAPMNLRVHFPSFETTPSLPKRTAPPIPPTIAPMGMNPKKHQHAAVAFKAARIESRSPQHAQTDSDRSPREGAEEQADDRENKHFHGLPLLTQGFPVSMSRIRAGSAPIFLSISRGIVTSPPQAPMDVERRLSASIASPLAAASGQS